MGSLFDGGGRGARSERLFFVSALLMVIASYLFQDGLRARETSVLGTWVLLALLQVYELTLLALAAPLVRAGQRRGAQALLVLGGLFLIDPSFLSIKAGLVDPFLGLAVVLVMVALLPLKAWLWRRTGLVELPLFRRIFLGGGLALLWSAPLTLNALTAVMGSPARAFHALQWLAAGILALPFLLGRQPSAKASAPERWLRFAPSIAAALSLGALAWAHSLSLSLAHLAPALAFLAVVARPHPQRRVGILAAMLILSAFPERRDFIEGSLLVPYRMAGLVILAFTVHELWLRRRHRDWAAAFGAMLLPISGASPSESIGNSARLMRSLIEAASAATPRGPLTWALLLMIGSFALLGYGALRSLRGAPEDEAGEA